jgi:D-serine deaminase-like pyridoxal phosphate-dependent protein
VRTAGQALALVVDELPGLALRGVHGYEGHCMALDDRASREAAAGHANQALIETRMLSPAPDTSARSCLAAELAPTA